MSKGNIDDKFRKALNTPEKARRYSEMLNAAMIPKKSKKVKKRSK